MPRPIVEGIMRLRKLSLFCKLLDHVPDPRSSCAILQPRLPMLQQLQNPLTGPCQLWVAVLRRRLQLRDLRFEGCWLLDNDRHGIAHVSMRDHGGDDGLKARWSPLDGIIRLVDAKDVGASFVMRQCP